MGSATLQLPESSVGNKLVPPGKGNDQIEARLTARVSQLYRLCGKGLDQHVIADYQDVQSRLVVPRN